MSREKKKSQPMSLRIEQTIADRLSAFCEQSGQSKTTAIERAIVAYIDDYESMMKKADTALYKSKRNGKSQYSWFVENQD